MKVTTKRTVSLLSAASAMAIAAAAHAQPIAPAAEDVAEIVVTGSRVTTVANSPTPLTVVSTEQLQMTTPKDIPDALNKLPVFQGSTGQRNQSGGGSNSSGNFLNLRNFGVERTLVLLDGRRVVASGQNGAVDTNALPQMLVQRVDIVTSGASAVYGSDAITGVVNFVLDTNLEGVKYEANAGIAELGVGFQYRAGLAAGTSLFGGRGHFIGSLATRSQEAVKYLDLPYGPRYWGQTGSAGSPTNPLIMTPDSRNFWSPSGRIASCGAGCQVEGQHFTSAGVLGPFNPGLPTGNSAVRMGGDGGFAIHPTAQGSLKTYESFGRFDYDLTETINAFVQSSYVVSRNFSVYFDPNIATGTTRNTYFKSNPYLSASARAQLSTGSGTTFTVDRILPETEPMSNKAINRLWNTTVGLSGDLGAFNWEAYYTHARNSLVAHNYHNPNNPRLMAAQDAVLNAQGQVVCYVSTVPALAALYPGCEPVNPFGPGTVTQTSHNWWAPTTSFHQVNMMDNVGGSITGTVFDLPAGPVRAALTGEARRQTLSIYSPDGPFTKPADCTGLRLCPPGHTNEWTFAVLGTLPKVSQSVWEVAGEANVPLLRDMPAVQSLELNLAARYTNYRTSGVVWAWKAGADYRLNDQIRFRATASRDIRAPTLTDLFGPYQASIGGFRDVHTNFASNSTVQNNPSNPNLVPETSRTYTAGIVLTPNFVPGLTFAVDWYKIDINNAISSISGQSDAVQATCEASGGTSPFCALYVRPFPFSNRTPENFPLEIRSQRVNAAVQSISGWDIELAYRFDLADIAPSLPGSVNFRSLVSLQPNNATVANQFVPALYPAAPKGRVTTFLTYNVGDWTFAAQNQWLSSWNKSQTALPQYYGDKPRVEAFHSTDITISKRMEIAGSTNDLFVNVSNVFDKLPPLWGGLAQSPGYSYPVPAGVGYPILGRTFTVGIRGRF